MGVILGKSRTRLHGTEKHHGCTSIRGARAHDSGWGRERRAEELIVLFDIGR